MPLSLQLLLLVLQLLPDKLINKVHFGDIVNAVDQVVAILNGDRPSQAEVLAFLQSELDFDRQMNAYADIIEKCKKRGRMRFSRESLTTPRRFTIDGITLISHLQR